MTIPIENSIEMTQLFEKWCEKQFPISTYIRKMTYVIEDSGEKSKQYEQKKICISIPKTLNKDRRMQRSIITERVKHRHRNEIQ